MIYWYDYSPGISSYTGEAGSLLKVARFGTILTIMIENLAMETNIFGNENNLWVKSQTVVFQLSRRRHARGYGVSQISRCRDLKVKVRNKFNERSSCLYGNPEMLWKTQSKSRSLDNSFPFLFPFSHFTRWSANNHPKYPMKNPKNPPRLRVTTCCRNW